MLREVRGHDAVPEPHACRPPAPAGRASSRAASSCPSRSARRARRARRARARTTRRRAAACRPPRRARPSATTTSRPERGGFRNSNPSVRRRWSGASTRFGLDAARAASASTAPVAPSMPCSGSARRTARAARSPRSVVPRSSPGAGRARPALAATRATRPGKYTDLPLSSSSTAVVTASRNQRSCATRITAASIVRSISSSHSSDSMSRWFVGSSSSRRSGWEASARASDARVSSPPENVAAAARGRRR